jgi:hypothetical protein
MNKEIVMVFLIIINKMIGEEKDDGLVENLYHLLWLTDDVIDKKPFPFSIPDTVVYKYSQPLFWFFTSQNGLILKKEKVKLNREKIETEFLKNVGPSGIVAYYIYNKNKENEMIK